LQEIWTYEDAVLPTPLISYRVSWKSGNRIKSWNGGKHTYTCAGSMVIAEVYIYFHMEGKWAISQHEKLLQEILKKWLMY
jgi:hypothetical protein